MRKSTKSVKADQCDWCKTELILDGKESDTYVVNAEHKIFCKIHTPGEEPEKDCMRDYVEDDKNKAPIIPLPNTIYKSNFYS